MGNTETMPEAQARVERETNAAASAIFPPGFTLSVQSTLSMPCADIEDKGTGQSRASVNYWVDNIDNRRNNEYFDKLKTWWANNGWEIETDKSPDDYMNATKDEYKMAIQTTITPDRRVSIGTNSPCVWPNGTPEPR
ncbi:hypothetical protein EWH70_27095 [Amycolatopsis suaedae]|uniref:Uncharacterized protein n=2 Tax=Amycolatopsis suaedae TaxID=2510978 RepID=A0A4Q7J213_9PSEU|nr:hypothetical protein EWH70_27095 [Amycolatopsis suaedae]